MKFNLKSLLMSRFTVRLDARFARFWVVHAVVSSVILGFYFVGPTKAESIYLSQNFDRGAAELFKNALTDEIDTVILSVSGGYLTEGMEIGRVIRARGLTTLVPLGATCLSACAEAFLGGVSMKINGTVAFHVPRAARGLSRAQAFDQGLAGGTMTAIYRFEMGFGFELTTTINRWTTSQRLLAFYDEADLLEYADPESGIKLPTFFEY